ncbi:MAG: hypothetical protein VB066_01640 [Paludibacter sp.]|jgi:hypothetical protein|nr:hypothetical protein [Paludibacter sp.]
MPIKLGKYSFAGPYTSIDQLRNMPGVFGVLCKVQGELFLFDVGESSQLKMKVENHENKECWNKNNQGQLQYYVRYTPFTSQQKRRKVELKLREVFQPTCGRDIQYMSHRF